MQMAGAMAGGMAAAMGSNEAGRSAADGAEDFSKLTRRRIYFNRLIGDLGEAQKVKTAHGKSMKTVLKFFLYGMVANLVILQRCMIDTCFSVSSGLKSTLTERPINPGSADEKTFNDITQPDQVVEWIGNVLVAQSQVSLPYSYPLSLLSYNRITPQTGVCPNSGSVSLTMRRVQTTTDFMKTTTQRFWQLFPETWMVATIAPGADQTEWEDVKPLERIFKYRNGAAEQVIPEALFGKDEFGGSLNPKSHLKHENVYTTWDYSANGGFRGMGGYSAILTLGNIDPDTGEIARGKQYVHLLSDTGFAYQNSSLDVCSEFKSTNVLVVDDFISADFFGTRYASIVIEFAVYNANYQTMSFVYVDFVADAAGLIARKSLTVDTFWLDIANKEGLNSVMVFLEVLYLFGTLGYFGLLGYRIWKNYTKSFRDVWVYINLASIISSMLALATWLATLKPGIEAFNASDDFLDLVLVTQLYSRFLLFSRASSFACLTIWLRLLETLSMSKARVKLLLMTLGMSAANMAIYIGYISVILMGFFALALSSFSAYAWNFKDPLTAMVSSFELFLGKVDVIDSVPDTIGMKLPFYLLFMMFFFFICVQMFNAIINYSYNRVSEDMEESFQRERDEVKRKERKNKHDQKKNPFRLCLDMVSKLWQSKDARDAQESAKQDQASDAAMAQGQGDELPVLENVDTEELRAKVDAFLGQEKQRKAPEGCFSVCMFCIFALSYIFFLYVNLSVNVNARIQAAIKTTIELEEEPLQLKDVSTVNEMAEWVTFALPRVIFLSTDPDAMERGKAAGIFPDSTVCIKTWNCIIPHFAADDNHATGSPKVVRLSQRKLKELPNFGVVDAIESDPPAIRFVGKYVIPGSMALTETAADGAQAFSEVLIPKRRPKKIISPGSAVSASDEVRDFSGTGIDNVTYNGEKICENLPQGEGLGGAGGLTCMLDLDQDSFQEQLGLIAQEKYAFYSLFTSSLAIEFMAYNGNSKTLIYSLITFTVDPSGKVTSSVEVASMLLMDLQNFKNEHTTIAVKLVPGLVYVFMVLYFLFALFVDLQGECERKSVNEGKTKGQTTVEFFTRDIFNAMEVVSICISLVSFVIFVLWLIKEGSLASTVLEGSFGTAMNFAAALASSAKLYNRLSAINMLIIFVRPMKFIRGNPRIAKLNQTLFDATADISWFVLVFIIAMFAFVMFAHVSFGPKMTQLSSVMGSVNYCFYYILGTFDFWPVFEADSMMSILFFPTYLILFYFVFTNIFFAIIDRNFVSAEPPPFNLKRNLKPIFSRVCRCIEWDEDYVMEEDPTAKKSMGPPSRRNRVHETAEKIATINATAGDAVQFADQSRKTKTLNEVCDMDERLSEVLHWSREEAKRFVDDFQRLLVKKQDPKKMKAEELFIRKEVMSEYVDVKVKRERDDMEQAERHKRYAIQVHEQMAVRDQDTLARYIQLLERKIKKRMTEKKSLLMEVHHLRAESEKMRFTEDERKRNEITESQVVQEDRTQPQNGQEVALPNVKDNESSSSDEEEAGGPGNGSVAGSNEGGQREKEKATKDLLNALTQ